MPHDTHEAAATTARRDDYEGVVYDLDGTLVRLPVDWSAAREDVADVYRTAGRDPATADLWELLERSREDGIYEPVEEAIAAHERAAAENATRLPTADELPGLADGVAVGVCSLNCEAACRTALDRHDLSARVGAVVGRDTVDAWKPDPRPLLATIERIDVAPSEAVFVGDSPRDEETARRAGVDFEYVGERPA